MAIDSVLVFAIFLQEIHVHTWPPTRSAVNGLKVLTDRKLTPIMLCTIADIARGENTA